MSQTHTHFAGGFSYPQRIHSVSVANQKNLVLSAALPMQGYHINNFHVRGRICDVRGGAIV